MPKRSFWREMTLVSFPCVLIGGVLAWGRWQERFRTPSIALSVQLDTKQRAPSLLLDLPEQIDFGWKAALKGGPKSGYHVGWNERIIAQTPRGPVLVWQLDSPPKSWSLQSAGGAWNTGDGMGVSFASSQNLNRGEQSRHYTFDKTALPLDTQSLAWHSHIVAIPSDNADTWQSPLPDDALQSWSQTPGATTWQKTISLPYDPRAFAPVLIHSKKSDRTDIGITEVSHGRKPGGVTLVEVLSRRGNRRTCRRLIAFNGTRKRTIWTDADGSTGYCPVIGTGGPSLSRDTESFFFDVGNMSPSWGEIVFLCDTVFDINKRAPAVPLLANQLSERALATFEQKFGGYRVSERLMLRSLSKTKPWRH